MTPSAPTDRPRLLDRALDRVERLGNRLPDPLVIFAGLFLITAVLTTVLAAFGAQAQVPGEDEPLQRSEEHTSELQSRGHLVCRLLLEKKKKINRDEDIG